MSRRRASMLACSVLTLILSNMLMATVMKEARILSGGEIIWMGRKAFLLISMKVEPLARPLMMSILVLHQKYMNSGGNSPPGGMAM